MAVQSTDYYKWSYLKGENEQNTFSSYTYQMCKGNKENSHKHSSAIPKCLTQSTSETLVIRDKARHYNIYLSVFLIAHHAILIVLNWKALGASQWDPI